LNIVFDLGGVVFNWQPDAIIRSIFEDPGTQDLVRKEIFAHSDWVELDRGTIALEQAIDNSAARTGLPCQDIERLLGAVPHFLTPIETVFIDDTPENLAAASSIGIQTIRFIDPVQCERALAHVLDT
jgi:FMN phosphatase YigB (HAD superfamily)